MASIISIVPIVLLFVLMLGFKMAGHKSALLTLVVTVLLALFAASPLGMIAPEHAGDSILALTGWAVVEGLLKAVFPILIIILMAIYSYNILVESKQIEVIKKQFTSITDDKGLLVLLLVWGFGGLLEGMAGFGTAVAIPAAILIGLGFKPMFSALVSLVGNTVATGFGAVGVPVTTLCNEVAESGSADLRDIGVRHHTVVSALHHPAFHHPYPYRQASSRQEPCHIPLGGNDFRGGAVRLRLLSRFGDSCHHWLYRRHRCHHRLCQGVCEKEQGAETGYLHFLRKLQGVERLPLYIGVYLGVGCALSSSQRFPEDAFGECCSSAGAGQYL